MDAFYSSHDREDNRFEQVACNKCDDKIRKWTETLKDNSSNKPAMTIQLIMKMPVQKKAMTNTQQKKT